MHKHLVTLERITALRQPEHADGALAGGDHHGFGEAQLLHVDIHNRAEVVGGHPQLLQANGSDEQDQHNWITKPVNSMHSQAVGLALRLAALAGGASGLTCMITAQATMAFRAE
ncbi:MAG: hypothetical protein KKE84_01690 [Gammaproteobacteria bacterium]|nr:hypothetical protein [Gammaproteobacteria bacterium]